MTCYMYMLALFSAVLSSPRETNPLPPLPLPFWVPRILPIPQRRLHQVPGGGQDRQPSPGGPRVPMLGGGQSAGPVRVRDQGHGGRSCQVVHQEGQRKDCGPGRRLSRLHSVNDVVCNFSPLETEETVRKLHIKHACNNAGHAWFPSPPPLPAVVRACVCCVVLSLRMRLFAVSCAPSEASCLVLLGFLICWSCPGPRQVGHEPAGNHHPWMEGRRAETDLQTVSTAGRGKRRKGPPVRLCR